MVRATGNEKVSCCLSYENIGPSSFVIHNFILPNRQNSPWHHYRSGSWSTFCQSNGYARWFWRCGHVVGRNYFKIYVFLFSLIWYSESTRNGLLLVHIYVNKIRVINLLIEGTAQSSIYLIKKMWVQRQNE